MQGGIRAIRSVVRREDNYFVILHIVHGEETEVSSRAVENPRIIVIGDVCESLHGPVIDPSIEEDTNWILISCVAIVVEGIIKQSFKAVLCLQSEVNGRWSTGGVFQERSVRSVDGVEDERVNAFGREK